MARTGISIKVSNTVLGGVPRVDSNSMLVVVGATATIPTSDAPLAFSLDTPFMLQSVDDLSQLGITADAADANANVYKQVADYYAKNAGSILWLVGTATNGAVTTNLADYVRATVVSGFQYRPRQIGVSNDYLDTETPILAKDLQSVVDALYVEGFCTVVVMGGTAIDGDIKTATATIADNTLATAPMVGKVICTNVAAGRPAVGLTLGYVASLSVGTSIGDASLPSQGDNFYFIDGTMSTDATPVFTPTNTPCAKLDLGTVNVLGDKGYIFLRTRPPRNGLWFNDGATGEDASTALSTLESGRTIASLVDNLRAFFSSYINSKVPVNKAGDIEAGYKADVLSNARLSVVNPFVENGDISDATIALKAMNDDMVGTRTWQVTLSVLPAPTLRWIDGYVFYVKSL